MCDECYAESENIVDDINAELERVVGDEDEFPTVCQIDGGMSLTNDVVTGYVDGLGYLAELRKLGDRAGLEAAWAAAATAPMKVKSI